MALTQIPNNMMAFDGGAYFMRNRLMNAQGNINQRGYTSGSATGGANQYTVDRWRVVTSGQNLQWTTSGNDLTFTAPAGGVEQVVEGNNIETGTYVLSWAGTATATVNGTSVANGGTIALTGGSDATVRFSGGTFSLPQLEKGTAQTPFERRPYGLELLLCQRYCAKIGGANTAHDIGSGVYGSTTNFRAYVPLPTTMRSSPSVTLVGAASGFSAAGNGTLVASAVVSGATNPNSVTIDLTVSGATAGNAGYARSTSTSTYLLVTAEL